VVSGLPTSKIMRDDFECFLAKDCQRWKGGGQDKTPDNTGRMASSYYDADYGDEQRGRRNLRKSGRLAPAPLRPKTHHGLSIS